MFGSIVSPTAIAFWIVWLQLLGARVVGDRRSQEVDQADVERQRVGARGRVDREQLDLVRRRVAESGGARRDLRQARSPRQRGRRRAAAQRSRCVFVSAARVSGERQEVLAAERALEPDHVDVVVPADDDVAGADAAGRPSSALWIDGRVRVPGDRGCRRLAGRRRRRRDRDRAAWRRRRTVVEEGSASVPLVST